MVLVKIFHHPDISALGQGNDTINFVLDQFNLTDGRTRRAPGSFWQQGVPCSFATTLT